jgi:hypothetical protein
MSNIKQVRIIADVPFNYLDRYPRTLPDEDIALIASAILAPSIGLTYSYQDLGFTPNDHGGQTSMYRLTIEGEEALSMAFLKDLAMALLHSGPLAKLHVAEARDLEFTDHEPWIHVVDRAELSGEARTLVR